MSEFEFEVNTREQDERDLHRTYHQIYDEAITDMDKEAVIIHYRSLCTRYGLEAEL
jgi:hypothetical protein